ncbi:MAG: T9SS type A sorting domain-containing protein [Candidatus Cloacimonetes bacterium]|nr:T9SS type A sorting domain-containing protein [Candidatus Cloacimonadota bacterium]
MKKLVMFTLLLLCSFCLVAQVNPLPDYWKRYSDMKDIMDSLATNYPELIMIEELGRSTAEDIPIWGVRISNNAQQRLDRPRILMLANIHAEEIIGMEICIRLMIDMVTQSEELPYRRWMNELETWIVPSMNPEGLNVVMQGLDVTFRKNKRINDPSVIPPFPYENGPWGYVNGVDLNRNWDWNWVHGDTLLAPSASETYDYYRGSAPFSESENIAIRDFALREQFLYAITWHSSRSGNLAETLYTPYNFQDLRPAPDWAINNDIGTNVAQRINKFQSGSSYSAAPSKGRKGDQNIWFYAKTGTVMFLIECGTSLIQPSEAALNSIISSCNNGMYWLFNRATRTGFDQDSISRSMLSVTVTDSLTGSPLSAEIVLHGYESDAVSPRISNSEHGRYWRPVFPGSYSFTVRKKGYEPKTLTGVNVFVSSWASRAVQLKPLHPVAIDLHIKANGTAVNHAFVSISDPQGDDEYEVTNGHIVINTFVGNRTLTIITENGTPFRQNFDFSFSREMTIDVGTANVLLSEDFMGDMSSWEINGPWIIVDFNRYGNNFDKRFLATNWGGYGFYEPGADVWVVTENPIQVPNDLETWLLLEQWLYTEWEHDYVTVAVSQDKEVWEVIYEKAGRYDSWHYNLIDLQPFHGQSIYVRFRLVDDTTDNSNLLELTDPGWYINSVKVLTGTTVADVDIIPEPTPLALYQNYPNPFNPETRISFSISDTRFQKAQIDIYNIRGQRVERIPILPADVRNSYVIWNPDKLASGIYLYRLSVDGKSLPPKKAVLLK